MNAVHPVVHIASLQDQRLRDYVGLTDVELRKVQEPAEGLYLAESLKIIRRALAAGHVPRSVLTSDVWLADVMDALNGQSSTTVFVGTESELEELTGFHLHRGAIASMLRPEPRSLTEVLRTARVIVVLEGVADHTNVGAVFRSVAALGADAVVVMNSCADPLYRRAVRVSMGAVLQVPWVRSGDWNEVSQALREYDIPLLGFALQPDAIPLEHAFESRLMHAGRVALLFGSEGSGLSRRALHACDAAVTIPMHHGVDSLNVATAAGIALWATRVHLADREAEKRESL